MMFNVVDHRYQLPSRKHLTTTVNTNNTTQLLNKMRQELSNVASACVKIDLRTNLQMWIYLGITGHCVQEYRYVSATCTCITGGHTSVNMD